MTRHFYYKKPRPRACLFDNIRQIIDIPIIRSPFVSSASRLILEKSDFLKYAAIFKLILEKNDFLKYIAITFTTKVMELTLIISNIIEKNRNCCHKPSTKIQVDPKFLPYLAIFNEIRQLVSDGCLGGDVAKIKSVFMELPPPCIDYLLELIVMYFEIGTRTTFRFLNKSVTTQIIFSACYNIILKDVYKSDNHILAFLYMSYLGCFSYYGRVFILAPADLENIIEDDKKRNYIETVILTNTNANTNTNTNSNSNSITSRNFKETVRSLKFNKHNGLFLKFCRNNNKLGIYKYLHLIDNIRCIKGVITSNIDYLMIDEIERSFLYTMLNVYQAIACMNSEHFLHQMLPRGVNKDIYSCRKKDLVNMMCGWIKKYSDCVGLIVLNVKSCVSAFLVLCVFYHDQKVPIIKIKKNTPNMLSSEDAAILSCYDSIHEYFNKECWQDIMEYLLCYKIENRKQYRVLEICMSMLVTLKITDDDFLLKILKSGTYTKAFSHATSKYVDKSSVTYGNPLWFDLSFKNERPHRYWGNGILRDPPIEYIGLKINGINNQVKPNMCISIFASEFGMNYKRLNLPQISQDVREKAELERATNAFKMSRHNSSKTIKQFCLPMVSY